LVLSHIFIEIFSAKEFRQSYFCARKLPAKVQLKEKVDEVKGHQVCKVLKYHIRVFFPGIIKRNNPGVRRIQKDDKETDFEFYIVAFVPCPEGAVTEQRKENKGVDKDQKLGEKTLFEFECRQGLYQHKQINFPV
jgi:hypothetical protein